MTGFSAVLGPLITISERQAAPSTYQHIISGLVHPLNHTSHRNPLVSVTFFPTQEPDPNLPFECYGPSLSVSTDFFPPSHETFPKTVMLITFLHLLLIAHFYLHFDSIPAKEMSLF